MFFMKQPFPIHLKTLNFLFTSQSYCGPLNSRENIFNYTVLVIGRIQEKRFHIRIICNLFYRVFHLPTSASALSGSFLKSSCAHLHVPRLIIPSSNQNAMCLRRRDKRVKFQHVNSCENVDKRPFLPLLSPLSC